MAEEEFLRRKEQAVIKDLESAFAGYARLVVQVNSIRTWTVSLMAATSGFILTRSTTDPGAVVVTALFALAAFMLLELRERSSMHFNKGEVLRIQTIFMVRDQDRYNDLISAYEFRDLRMSKLTRSDKLIHLFRSAVSWQVCIWYGFWAAAVLLSYFVTYFQIAER